MAEKKVTTTCVVEVSGLAPKVYARLTEAGCEPLANGALIQLPIDVARSVVETDPVHFAIKGQTSSGIDPKLVKDEAEDFRYKVLQNPNKASPVATEKAAGTAIVGKPANRAMDGKAQEK